MKSVITPQEYFTHVANPQIQRSTFDRSHGLKTTFDAGKLIPIFVDEALPGDTLNLKSHFFGRLATPLTPFMDNVFIDFHFFSIPNRLVWDNFQRMMGEQDNPDDTTDYIEPTMTSPAGGYDELSLFDYMQLPTKIANMPHRSVFLRAVNLTWNEWYRDQNLQDSVPVHKGDSDDPVADYNVLPRGKRKDYFTSALPWAQKAEPVTIPLGGTIPVTGDITTTVSSSNITQLTNSDDSYLWLGHSVGDASLKLGTSASMGAEGTSLVHPAHTATSTHDLSGNLSEATTVTINQLRESFQIQKMYEKDARGGTRYTELIRAHYGVISPDARLQRPEYLGGGTVPLNVNPIAQTSASQSGGTPQANLAAIGTFSANDKGFFKSFTEHEIILGFVSARADLNYQQGLPRMWSRSTRFDYFWPTLAHLGEQQILNKEIYAQGDDVVDEADRIIDNLTFGYQERYAEYRYKPSMITGRFRSNATQSLDIWHLSQDFSALPALNADFIKENPPIDRVIAVQAEPQFILDCYFDYKCTRPMPTYATPGLIDHF